MNMRLFQDIFELNQAFARVIEGLKRMEKVTLFPPEVVRETRAEVVLVQVDLIASSSISSTRSSRKMRDGRVRSRMRAGRKE